jgi:hypothetical protein
MKLFSGPLSKSDAICDLSRVMGSLTVSPNEVGVVLPFISTNASSAWAKKSAPSCVPLTAKFHGERRIKHRPKV